MIMKNFTANGNFLNEISAKSRRRKKKNEMSPLIL